MTKTLSQKTIGLFANPDHKDYLRLDVQLIRRVNNECDVK
jgi:hypothetical protein